MKLTMATIRQELKDKHLLNGDIEDRLKRFKGKKNCQQINQNHNYLGSWQSIETRSETLKNSGY